MRFSIPLCAIAAAVLSACGGGGGASDSLPDAVANPVIATVLDSTVNAEAGKTLLLSGKATSRPNALTDMKWTVTKLVADAPDISVSNADCAAGARSTRTLNNITESTWSCDLVITAPKVLVADSTYRFTFVGTDNKGNTSSGVRDILVRAGGTPTTPSAPPVVSTSAAVSVSTGADVGLSCFAQGGSLGSGGKYVYNWVVKSNPNGLPVSLTAGENGALSFEAPAVRSQATLTLQCRVTDDALATSTADTVVTINPVGASSVVANAGQTQTVTMGASVNLDATGSKGPDNAPIYFKWTQLEGAPVSLSDATSGRPSFIAPTVREFTRLTFQLVASGTSPASESTAAPTELSTVAVYVNPQQPLTLTISDANVIKANSPAALRVNVAPLEAGLTYAWTQVSGPSVVLGGANTSQASFIAPAVTGAPVQLVFQVSVARGPIALADPREIAKTDVVISVEP